jgi:TonB family protein
MKRLTALLVTVAMMAILTFIGASYVGAQDASTKAQAEAHINLGTSLGAKGDLDGAIKEYREALRLNPNYWLAHYDLGVALGNKGDWNGQVAEEREALRLNPNYAAAHINLGVALGHINNWDEDIEELHEALRLEPNNSAAHYNLGVALRVKDDWDGAITEYREAIRLNPNFAEAHYNLGIALGHKKDWDGAMAEYQATLRLNPGNVLAAGAHYNLGIALRGKGQLENGVEEFRESVRLNPNDYLAHWELGMALYVKDPDGAIVELREAVRVNPKSVLARYFLASLLGAKGDIDGRIDQLRAILGIPPNTVAYTAMTHCLLGSELEKKGDLKAALEEYHTAYTLVPSGGIHKGTTYKQDYENLLHKMEPNKDSGTGGEIYSVGGNVSAPIPVYKPEPTYTEEARKAKYQGAVVLWIVVDSQGNVTDARLAKPLGLGLDEKALETVRTWKFKPALRNGVPVSVRATVEVSFRL